MSRLLAPRASRTVRAVVASLAAGSLLHLVGTTAQAQNVSVQQPVTSGVGVSTSVSVPDRGSTFLGGVSNAASSRSTYGPLRTGPSGGSSLSSGSLSAHVYIHDLQAMDEALLSTAPDTSTDGIDFAGRLASRRQQRASTLEGPSNAATPDRTAADKAQRFEQLARAATARGQHTVARLHWQAAQRAGSKVAATELSSLTAAPRRPR